MNHVSSPRLQQYLVAMGMKTPEDVANHLPRRYDSFLYTDPSAFLHLGDKQKVVVFGTLIARPEFRRFPGVSVTKFYLREERSHRDFCVEAWNRPYLSKYLQLGEEYTVQGNFDAKGHCLNLTALRKGKVPKEEALVPIYALPKDYPDHAWRELVRKCLASLEGHCPDVLPPSLNARYRFLSHYEALRKCHFPTCPEDIHQGLRVLKYEEALLFSLRNQLIRTENTALSKWERTAIPRGKIASFIASLPYPLTADQKKAVEEGMADMDAPRLMYRLLQGDVGTGKTLVAALLLYANALRGEQGALLAPTDSLARQHYETLRALFSETGLHITLLVGNLAPEERRGALEDIEDGTSDIVIGTHALFSKNVVYASLGLAVIDEQHKFGVNQRALLCGKGEAADVLLMSATPIPRTLSLTLYGDMDVSILAEFPSSKRDILTKIAKPLAKEVTREIAASIASGHRVYIVAPQIEEGEDPLSSAKAIYEEFAAKYPGLVALMHGKQSQEEKEDAIASFREGTHPLLVSTSVIEVGIDVKQANLMLIYDPTHFALSSLHQLRGRIGRDGSPAKCYLLYEGNDEEERSKLNVLVASNDGFRIAEEDLRRRGPGELAGTKQSGLPEFHYVNIVEDFKMFEYARNDAARIAARPEGEEENALLERVRASLSVSSLA